MAPGAPPRSLVTGGAGFIGSHLVDALLAAGQHVTVLDDLSTGRWANLDAARRAHPDRLAVHPVGLGDPGLGALVAAAAPDTVFHLAAQMDVRVSVADPVADATTNVVGTVALLSALARAGGGQHLLFASSGGTIYGSPAEQPVAETAPLTPLSPYAAAKAAVEPYLTAFRDLAGVRSTVLALGNVVGPRQRPDGEAGVVTIFAAALLAGKPTTVFGDGTSTRDYVDVADVVTAFQHFADGRAAGRRINVGSGVATDVRTVHRLVATCTGAPDAPTLAPPRPGELPHIALDVRAAAALGWRPVIPLAVSVQRTVAWLRAASMPG